MIKKEMIAMLLAGGQGSRLGVLTEKVAKPAVAFGGKYRIIDFPLSNCINSGIDRRLASKKRTFPGSVFSSLGALPNNSLTKSSFSLKYSRIAPFKPEELILGRLVTESR